MEINIVDTLLGYISEYVNIEILDENTDEVLCTYNGRNSIDEEYLGSAIKDFIVDNGLVTIWVYTEQEVKMNYCAFNLNDILFAYDLTFNELTELLENLGTYLDMENDMGNAICALDNIYTGEE